MSIQLGQIAPDFEQDSTRGPIHFHDWLGSSWAVLFSHPKNSAPVCSTELGEVAKLRPEWDRRGVKPIGLSVDPVEADHKWEADIAETQGGSLDFPIIADPDAKVSTLYGMTHPESDPKVTVRSVFVIDPTKKVRLILSYLPSTGRTFAEILRTIDSLQLTDAFDPVI
jgi:thioredoxin-dependent peroxiredoxin